MNQELKRVIECTQPWYVRLKQEDKVEYQRVVLWGLYEDGVMGDKFRYSSPMVVMDGTPAEATQFDNYDGLEYRHGWTDEVVEKPE